MLLAPWLGTLAHHYRAATETTKLYRREGPTEPAKLEESGQQRSSGIVLKDSFEDPLPVVGDIVGECYRIVGEAGRGAMGVVLTAIDERLERRVAIKLLHTQLRDDSLRERFYTEARTMALVSHRNVANIFTFGEHRGVPYFAMEYIEGQTVGEWLGTGIPLPAIDAVLKILDDACLGVSAIHEAGAIHRDIKPSNLLLDAEGRTRVADFGLAQRATTDARAHEVAGTLAYMAPELAFSDGEQLAVASQRSDVYALGCVAYELLTGQLPFDADTDVALMLQHATEPPPLPSARRPDLTKAFDDVLLRALAKKPEQRTASAEVLRRELHEAHQRWLEPMRILVAEDDEDFRDLLGIKLSAEFPGATIECVEDGSSAILAFDRNPASVVLLDLQMPNLDGVDVTAVLRNRKTAARVPILVLTASGGPVEWKLMSSLGADRFLVKPVNLDDVVVSIRSALKERRALADGRQSA